MLIHARGLAGLLVFLSAAATASDPQSHTVDVPNEAGQSLTFEWTGTVLQGASGVGSTCAPGDPTSDTHDVVLNVPDGFYDALSLVASFNIQWDDAAQDLALTIQRDGLEEGSSDGGAPSETVTLDNPAAGTLVAVACPFAATADTPYRGTLTIDTVGPTQCLDLSSSAVAHSTTRSAGLVPNPEERGLPNFDVWREAVAERAPITPPAGLAGRRLSAQFDSQIGLPSFLWARTNAQPITAAPLLSERERLIDQARQHLRNEASLLGLTDAMIANATVHDAGYNGNGPAVVRFDQQVGGLEVFKRRLNVMLDRDGVPVAVSGYFATDLGVAAPPAFALNGAQAVASAWVSLGGALSAGQLAVQRQHAGYDEFNLPLLTGSHRFERAPRAKAVYYAMPGRLVPAYEVELFATAVGHGQLTAYSLIVSAADGSILSRKNLVHEVTTTYRVFADDSFPYQPFDMPLGNTYAPFPSDDPGADIARVGVPTRLVTLDSGPISTADPWLGEGATNTVGNNVDACIDSVDAPSVGLSIPAINTCDEELGDTRAEQTSPNTFDYEVEADSDPSTPEAIAAANVNMFFIVNWLHDWWYDHGFDEAAGNAQEDNYGRGGADGDSILAQGQDASGRNNANMATPADGSSPTMQQYLFDGAITGEVRTTEPAGQPLEFSGAGFGPQTFDETSTLVLASDAVGEPTDGCGADAAGMAAAAPPPQASLAGNVALIDRGGCSFTTKAQFALASGAVAMVVVNNTDGPTITMGNGDIPINAGASPTDAIYQIPSVMILRADGDAIKAQLAAGGVTMRVQRLPSTDFDGTLDNQIIAHEIFHYVHNRLIDQSNQQGGAMSEGWGDINGWMFSARPEDRLVFGNDAYQGTYSLAGYVANNFFAGIRRVPYTTEFSKNAFTFQHIANGNPTPDGGDGANNSQVHNSGEVWSNAMWECYVGLLNDPRHSFEVAQNRMKDYIIASMKMSPADTVYTEARDAMLAAVLATDEQDFAVCSAGFAKRGMGLFAQSAGRDSADHVGTEEDFTPFVCNASVVTPPGTGGGASPAAQPTGNSGGALGIWLVMVLLGGGMVRRRRA